MTCATSTRPTIGDKPTTTATFAPDAAHTGAVVTAVTVTLKHPDLTITHPTAVETGPNVWRIDWPTLDLHGRWYMHVAATGGLIAADEIWVDVEPAAAL
jgi:hypothetical protein